ncbi:MAG: ORF6N domain-containing protein [Nitrospiraceae bacterium]|nr:MAG: ORF6N domain-containing protein [Nitrospiraceae bacterium]
MRQRAISNEQSFAPAEQIERAILLIRGQKVMLDADLAELYGVETKALNRAVKRNRERFPEDFMLQLTVQEVSALRCQFGTSNIGRGGRRYSPYVFTEQGVAMLSTVLNSARAIQVNIAIMRAFVKLREMLSAHTELRQKLAELERTLEGHDGQIRSLFDAIRQLMAPPHPKPRKIGFRA